jgi:hypothetical protein
MVESVGAPARPRLATLALALGVGAAAVAKAEEPDRGTPKQSCWGSHGGCEVSGALKVAPRIEPTPELQKLFGGKVFAAFSIDLDSDGRPDFIVEHSKDESGGFRTCFVDADRKVRSCWKSFDGDGFSFMWFAQLDSDPMLELFEMDGDEDYSHYTLRKLDPKTWKPKDVLTVAPLIRTDPNDPRKTFWGYPWDVHALPLQEKAGRVRLLVGDPEALCGVVDVDNPDLPHPVPIFFTGVPTQGEPSDQYVRAVASARFLTLEEAKQRRARAKRCPHVEEEP